jgi:hypothetical protein
MLMQSRWCHISYALLARDFVGTRTSSSSIALSVFRSLTTEAAAMSLPDDAEKSAIVARVRTFTEALDQLTLDHTAQERCLAASHDVMRLLQGLINRLNRP